MPIAYLGALTATSNNGGACSIQNGVGKAFTTTGGGVGVDNDWITQDIICVWAWCGPNRTGAEGALTRTAGTAVTFNEVINTTIGANRVRVGWYHYTPGPTNGSVIQSAATGNASDGCSLMMWFFKGVDLTTPLDVTITTATNAAATNPDPPSITPTSADCQILAGYASNIIDTSPSGAITNYALTERVNGNDTLDSQIGGAVRLLSGGAGVAENPGSFNTYSSSAWLAFTAALRPVTLATITGTLSGTETAADTATITGAAVNEGTLAATEAAGADTASMTGTVSDPDPPIDGTLAATESGSDTATITGAAVNTGTLAATEAAGQDSISVTASNPAVGTVGATETAADTTGTEAAANAGFDDASAWTLVNASISGGKLNVTSGARFLVQTAILVVGRTYNYRVEYTASSGANLRIGNSPTTNGSDIVVGPWAIGSGPQVRTGSFTATNTAIALEADTAVFSGEVREFRVWEAGITGNVAAEGALSATEAGSDTASITGELDEPDEITGSLSTTEAGADTSSIAGSPIVSGAAAATEAGSDTATLTGAPVVAGSLGATEVGQDTASATGSPVVTGTAAATEQGSDTLSVTAAIAVAGSLGATEAGSDTSSFTADLPVSGAVAGTEAGTDAASAAGQVSVDGALAAAEAGSDTSSIEGSVVDGLSGTLNATETGSDTFASTAVLDVVGAVSGQEAVGDQAAVSGSVALSGALSATEAGQDAAAIEGSVEQLTGSLAAQEVGEDTANITAVGQVSGALGGVETSIDNANITGDAGEPPVEAEPERLGGPALGYSRHDRVSEYLHRRRARKDRKRTLEEVLAALTEEADHGTAGVKPRTQAAARRAATVAQDEPEALPHSERQIAPLKPVSARAMAAEVAKTLQPRFRKMRQAEAEAIANDIIAEDTKRRRRRAAALLLLH